MSNEACVTDLWQKRRSKGMEEEEPAEGGSKKLIFEKKNPCRSALALILSAQALKTHQGAVSKRPSAPCKRPSALSCTRGADSVREGRLSAHMQRLSALVAKKSFKLFLFSFSRIYLVIWEL